MLDFLGNQNPKLGKKRKTKKGGLLCLSSVLSTK